MKRGLHGQRAPSASIGIGAGRKQRVNPRPHDRHQRSAAGTDDRRALLHPGQCPRGSELQQQMEQRDQALAVGMQKAEIARSAEAGNALLRIAGFKRIRHYGLLASCHKAAHVATCRALFGLPAPAVLESDDAFMARGAQVDLSRYPHCADGRMRVIAALAPLRRIHTPRSSTGPPP